LCQAGKYGVIHAPTWKCKDLPDLIKPPVACYSVDKFDPSTSKWPSYKIKNYKYIGIGRVSSIEIIETKVDLYSKSRPITYVQGSAETGFDFGNIITSSAYTVCSVQYTGSFKYGENLYRARPGIAKGTPPSTTDDTRHNWIASCATNVDNSTYFVNGIEHAAHGGIAINPENKDQKYDWGVAFLATWDSHLDKKQMKVMSNWLNLNISSPLFLDYPRIPCLPCVPGKYNNEVGKLTCQNCISGTYAANDKCENGLQTITIKKKGRNGISYMFSLHCDYPGDSVAETIGISSIQCDKLPGVKTCSLTSRATDENTCQKFGMNIVIPRSEMHWKILLDRYDKTYFSVVPGIYKETDGNSVEVPMNSDAMTATGENGYRALDGGKWWLRDDMFSQPDNNYAQFAWLGILNITDTSNIQFRSFEYQPTTNKYICSFNNQQNVPPEQSNDCILDLNRCEAQSNKQTNMDSNCKKCRSGKHGTMDGATNETEGCEQCKLGKFAVDAGSRICDRECSPGKYQSKNSSPHSTDPNAPGVCTACNPGFYCPEKNGVRVAIPCVCILFLCSFFYIYLSLNNVF
jgi:hypothetical protein